MTNKIIRTFLAVPLDAAFQLATVELLHKLQKQHGAENIKWSKPENLHLTLRFLGTTPAEKIPELTEKISAAVKKFSAVQIAVKKVDKFPLSHAHTVGIYFTLSKPLAELIHTLEKNIIECGFSAEKRPFIPHVTLGRISSKVDFVVKNIPALPAMLTINEVILFRSDIDEAGSVYTALEKFKLI